MVGDLATKSSPMEVVWNSRQEFPSVEVIVEGAEEELQQSFPPI